MIKDFNHLSELVDLIQEQQLTDIVIQIHDNPDADAFGSGYAVYRYLLSKGTPVPRFFYSGAQEVRKANMLLMKELLGIPVCYVRQPGKAPELLITVDCRYRGGNVKPFDNQPAFIAVIDHHRTDGLRPEDFLPDGSLMNIRPNYDSCAAIIARMFDDTLPEDALTGSRFTLNTEENVATALYYGMYMDTNALSELKSAADKDLCKAAKFNVSIQRQLANTNITDHELRQIGNSLNCYNYSERYRCAIAEVNTTEAGVLGITADLLVQVDTVDTCIVYFADDEGYRLSVRSCVNTISAANLVQYILRNEPSEKKGGGHFYKAGGVARYSLVQDMPIKAFLHDGVRAFHEEVDLIRAKTDKIDMSDMELYEKNPVIAGYLPSTELTAAGRRIMIHMLEGDTTEEASDELYLMVGVVGEVYPIKRGKFKEKYETCDELPDMTELDTPTVLIEGDESSTDLTPKLHGCKARKERVLAKVLKQNTRVFTSWHTEGYLYGKTGDYLVCPENDTDDVYTVRKDIMHKSYTKLQTAE